MQIEKRKRWKRAKLERLRLMNKRKYPDDVPEYERKKREKEKSREETIRNKNITHEKRVDMTENNTVKHVGEQQRILLRIRMEETSTIRSKFRLSFDKKKA